MGIKDIQIDETGVIALLARETEEKLRKVVEKYGMEGQLHPDNAGEGKADGTVVSPGLKLRRKKDNTLMTVYEIGPEEVTLRTPEGELYKIIKKNLDAEYSLD